MIRKQEKKMNKKFGMRGTWGGAQLVKCLTLDSGLGHELRVMKQSPALGSALS